MVDWFDIYEKAKLKRGVSIDLVNDTEVLACWLFDIPVKQQDASKKVIEITSELAVCKDLIQELEDKMALEINSEVDEKGKSMFGNQSLRDAEMRMRLVNDGKYIIRKRELVSIFEALGKAKAEVDYWGTMFSAVKNEIYHRRAVELLDSKKDMDQSGVKNMINNM